MRYPLIVSFDPRLIKGPVVFLPEGSWGLRGNYEGREIYICHVGSEDKIKIDKDTKLVGNHQYFVEFPQESKHISAVTLYAEKLEN